MKNSTLKMVPFLWTLISASCLAEFKNNQKTPDGGGLCGNGAVDPGEECDGKNISNLGCVDLGYEGGTLSCDGTCLLDTSKCNGASSCGNGLLDDNEDCDGTAFGDANCSQLGFVGGEIACSPHCLLDTTQCRSESVCGDGFIDSDEYCDDGNTASGDGCSDHCQIEDWWFCNDDPSTCTYSRLTWIHVISQNSQFSMGSDTGDLSEQPVHTVSIEPFEMTESEVTMSQYGVCVQQGACTHPSTGIYCNWENPGYELHPANCVTWTQASDFCAFAGGRLPSEAEWEFAARSGGQDISYPWGFDMATCNRVVMDDGGDGCGEGTTGAVCSKPAGNSSQGICDLAGNVWEWVQDTYHDDYTGAPTDGTAWVTPEDASKRMLRGGSFADVSYGLRATNRYSAEPSTFNELIGFRCVK